MSKVAWIGLGVMGYPMAGHLAKAGYEVTVFHRSPGKAKAWTDKFGGRSVGTTAAAEGAEFVFSCVGANDDLRSVTTASDGAFQSMATGTNYVRPQRNYRIPPSLLDLAGSWQAFRGVMQGNRLNAIAG